MKTVYTDKKLREAIRKVAMQNIHITGKRLESVTIGIPETKGHEEARPGEEVYVQSFGEIPPRLYGPYTILLIEETKLPTSPYGTVQVYIDRVQFTVPVNPRRLLKRQLVENRITKP